MIDRATTERRRRAFATKCAAILLLGAALASAPAQAGPLPPLGRFTYSNLCWSLGSGDAAGYRLVLERSGTATSLSISWGDGPLSGPVRAEGLKLDSANGTISFDLPRGEGDVEHFAGEITDRSVMLMSGQEVSKILRIRSPLKRMHYCR